MSMEDPVRTLDSADPERTADDAEALDLLRRMLTIRATEEALLSLHASGQLRGTVHTCIGQEPCAVGVVSVLETARDVIWSNHRGHGHYLAATDDVEGLVAEVMGKATGTCKGIGGSQHLQRGGYYSNGILGGIAPCAVGSALAEQAKGTGAAAVVFLGDGAMAEGAVTESLNAAALWKLPLLFVVEHNGWAQSTPTHLEHAGDIATRGTTFGIPTVQLVADDVIEVRDAARALVARARAGDGPALLLLRTYRIAPHSKGDDTRSAEHVAQLRSIDPLVAMTERLRQREPDAVRAIEVEVRSRIDGAVAASVEAPSLSPRELGEWVR